MKRKTTIHGHSDAIRFAVAATRDAVAMTAMTESDELGARDKLITKIREERRDRLAGRIKAVVSRKRLIVETTVNRIMKIIDEERPDGVETL